jgi:RND family efflux transporter MFP subunit
MRPYIIIIATVLLLASCSDYEKKVNKEQATEPTYQLTTIEKGGVPMVTKLPAQLAAYEQVSIFPKVNGYVKEVFVDIGSHVKQGQILMTLEDPELIQLAFQAKEKYEKTKADYIISKENYQRLSEAAQTPGAVSPLDVSTARSTAEADSSLSNAAKANWQMEETMLSYLNITAPFTGVITARNVHPGALVNAVDKDIPMLELKEIAHLRLQVDIPENIAATLNDKDSISFYTSAFPGEKMIGYISRKSDNVNEQYRTERMEIDVYNNDGLLAPGMYADVVLQSNGNPNAFSVPKSAVVTSTERKYILVMKNQKITKVDVSTGNETVDNIAVYGSLQPGDSVITNANDEIAETDK